MLYFTGFARDGLEIAKTQIENTPKKRHELSIMQQMVDEAISVLFSNDSIAEFGRMLHEAWKLKRSISEKISTSHVDGIYEAAREAGALGGKLLGAGGGGFVLLFVRPEEQPSVKQRLHGLLHVPFKFETYGTQIVVYEPNITPNYF